jgi:hypothetical protein
MANPAVQSRKYFLGIGGAQSGPFSDADVIEKIKTGQVAADTLVWYEGLSEWQPAGSISAFKEAFSGGPPESTNTNPSLAKVISNENVPAQTAVRAPSKVSATYDTSETYSGLATPGEPVFAKDEGLFENTLFIRYRNHVTIGVLVIGVFALLTVLNKIPSFLASSEVRTNLSPSLRAPTLSSRESDLRKALSEIQLKPQTAIPTLTKLIQEKDSDNVGKEALAAALEFYRRNQKYELAGELLLTAKQPREAAKFFLMDPSTARQAESALFKSYEEAKTKGPEEKELLLQDISLLLGPVQDMTAVTNRIQILERDFPGDNHPYKYYLKTPEGKLTDLFSRIAFFFVNSLMFYVQSELPQIHFEKRPVVELVREADGKYRIIGRYEGEVELHQDRLTNIRFLFWLSDKEWSVVETNITGERKKYAAASKIKLKGESVSAEVLLKQLESIFKQQFPKNSLHEAVTPDIGTEKQDKSSY